MICAMAEIHTILLTKNVNLEAIWKNVSKITKFPCDLELQSFHCRIIHEEEVLVYCVCRYSEATTHFGNMACCDACNQWYHEHCLKIPKEVFGSLKEKKTIVIFAHTVN